MLEVMDPFTPAVTEPARLLIGLGALAGLLAAQCWWRVWRSIDASLAGGKGPDLDKLSQAVRITCGALLLGCGGYLARAVGLISCRHTSQPLTPPKTLRNDCTGCCLRVVGVVG